jgi:phosphinothricin acetyltransferase
LEKRLKWLEDHEAKGYPILVAADGDIIAGWSSLSVYSERYGYRFTAETSVYIRESHRGRGVGTDLMRELIREAELRGFHSLIARIGAENEVSIRMHEKLGYRVAGRLYEMIHKFDRWIDTVYMQKLLDCEVNKK